MIKKAFLALCATGTFLISSSVLALPSCKDEIYNANKKLTNKGLKPVRDVNRLFMTIKTFNNTDQLPSDYVTTEEAKQKGWSGNSNDSLWGIWALNKKIIGGDPYTDRRLTKFSWISADLDSVRGLRSESKLILSRETGYKFITTNNYKDLVQLKPCQ